MKEFEDITAFLSEQINTVENSAISYYKGSLHEMRSNMKTFLSLK